MKKEKETHALLEGLVRDRRLEAALQLCEEEEIRSEGGETEVFFSMQMCLYLITEDLDNARFLWKRIPPLFKSEEGDAFALWEVGKALWRRSAPDAYACLRRRPQWSPGVDSLVAVLAERLTERQRSLMAKAYTAVPLDAAAARLGMTTAQAKAYLETHGWTLAAEDGAAALACPPSLSGSGGLVGPDERRLQALPLGDEQLIKMSEYITFLEGSRQGVR